MHKYFVIVPAYNESINIGPTLTRIKKFPVEIIVVDDGSSDSTYKIACKYADNVLKHELNLGKGAALKTGCEYAFNVLKADGVIFVDGDGQHHPKEILNFVKELEKGHELIFGVRQLNKEMPWVRMISNRILSYTVNILFGKYIPDILSGFKAISRSGYEKIAWEAQGYDVETEIAVRTAAYKLDYVTIPISTVYNKMDRGMTVIDALNILPRFIEWRLRI